MTSFSWRAFASSSMSWATGGKRNGKSKRSRPQKEATVHEEPSARSGIPSRTFGVSVKHSDINIEPSNSSDNTDISNESWSFPTMFNLSSDPHATEMSPSSVDILECPTTSTSCSQAASENEELEIVFSRETVDQDTPADNGQKEQNMEDAVAETASISSEMVQTGDPYWDALLLAALTDVPFYSDNDREESSMDDNDLGSSNGNFSDSGTDDEASLEEALDDDDAAGAEWTDLTKDPQVLGVEVQHGPVSANTAGGSALCTGTTVLGELLWGRDYNRVEQRILSHPEEVSTRVDLPCSHNDKVRGLPLHLACAMRPLPPLSTFQLLLSICPEAAQQPEEKWGMLPLHFAVNLSQYWGLIEAEPQIHPVPILETLLEAYPTAIITKERYQEQTPLHLAASTTLQSIDARISPTSHAIINLLMDYVPSEECLWETDARGDAAYDIALRRLSGGYVELDWKPNPLLQLCNSTSIYYTHSETDQRQLESMKKLLQQPPPSPEDYSFSTDATSVSLSLSSGSVTEKTVDGEEETAEGGGSSFDNADENQSWLDDATYVTAMTHEMMENFRGDVSVVDDEDDAATIGTVEQDSSDDAFTVGKDEDAFSHDTVATMDSSSAVVASNRCRPFIPRAVQVDKVSLQLQVQVSELIRSTCPSRGSKALVSSMKESFSINPYFQVELYHAASDISVLLHQSEPYYQRTEAVWAPVRFAIDATIAQSMGMVLCINVFHKPIKVQSAKKEKARIVHVDEWIGGHQASPWELCQSVDAIPLVKGEHHHSPVTGQLRLLSYEMMPMEKAKCWRIFL